MVPQQKKKFQDLKIHFPWKKQVDSLAVSRESEQPKLHTMGAPLEVSSACTTPHQHGFPS